MFERITIEDVEAAARTIAPDMEPTPQRSWPLLCERLGTEVWAKHENHTPVGAFKIRGGLFYFARMAGSPEIARGVISATRGNHGQSIAFAARRRGVRATIVVPHGNSVEKNAAMRALGAELIEHGDDFQDARERAGAIALERSLHVVPSFHPLLVTGVATYALELFRAVADIDVAYVPIGLGSGICGVIAVRDALGLRTEIVGVVSAHAPAYAESLRAGRPVESRVTTVLADGMACRVPDPDALDAIRRGAARVVEVTDDEIAEAMRTIFECSHSACEGAGAAAFAAATKERDRLSGRKVAVILSGANVDREVFARVLSGPAPM